MANALVPAGARRLADGGGGARLVPGGGGDDRRHMVAFDPSMANSEADRFVLATRIPTINVFQSTVQVRHRGARLDPLGAGRAADSHGRLPHPPAREHR